MTELWVINVNHSREYDACFAEVFLSSLPVRLNPGRTTPQPQEVTSGQKCFLPAQWLGQTGHWLSPRDTSNNIAKSCIHMKRSVHFNTVATFTLVNVHPFTCHSTCPRINTTSGCISWRRPDLYIMFQSKKAEPRDDIMLTYETINTMGQLQIQKGCMGFSTNCENIINFALFTLSV